MLSSEKQFTNFKIHTQYSICEGAIKIDELAEYCKSNKIKSIGLTDSYNLCGALEFSEKISSMMDENEHVEIDIFSDDVEWCKDNFKYKHITPKYVELESDIDELYMMSNFTNIIITY